VARQIILKRYVYNVTSVLNILRNRSVRFAVMKHAVLKHPGAKGKTDVICNDMLPHFRMIMSDKVEQQIPGWGGVGWGGGGSSYTFGYL
jgi:hypothetical protein